MSKVLLVSQQLSASVTNLKTATTATAIDAATATNTTGAPVTISVHLVPSGGSVGDGNAIYKDHSISANSTVNLSDLVNHAVEGSGQIAAGASSASAVSLNISGRDGL